MNHAPSGHLKTTQEEIFPGQLWLQNLNQSEPVLASAESTKNLKFSTFSTNFTYFYFEFLKDSYIFRIAGPPELFWYQWLQDSSSINREKYCPQKLVISI